LAFRKNKLSSVYFVPEADTLLEKIPFIYDKNSAHFVTIGIAQQIFTPTDTNLSVQIGIIGKYSGGG